MMKWKTMVIVVGSLPLLLFLGIVFRSGKNFPHFEPLPSTNSGESERMSKTKTQSNNTKIILFYTSWFGRKPWPDFASSEVNLSYSNCPETEKCKITYNNDDIGKSDLVIFHARDMKGSVIRKELQQIQTYRSPSQRMAFFCLESPQNDPLNNIDIPDGFFNWTLTFKTESDFHFPYGSYARLSSAENPPPLIDYAASKSKFVMWTVSNCGHIREKYVKKLLNYISVDVYGGCSRIYGQNNQCSRSRNCEDIFKPYKFTLAFENGVCTDYITEKFWMALQRNTVPVVLARDYYSADVVPPASFISVQDFPSVKALAEYLLYLAKNDTAYNEYFSWRQKFVSNGNFHFKACKLCDALHDGRLKPKAYSDDMFKKFWNKDIDCKTREETLSRLIDKE